MIVTIDGPAAAGKSTTARGVAEALGFKHMDTGAMYRAVTYYFLQKGIDPQDSKAVAQALDELDLQVEYQGREQLIRLNGQLLTDELRLPEVTQGVSQVSALAPVRQKMVTLQRELARHYDVVTEGRDMGTVVFPDAELKIYLVADLRTRAERRRKELLAKGIDKSLDEVEQEIRARDEYDSSRTLSPLKPAPDALVLDTTGLSIDEQVAYVVSNIKTMPKFKGGNA